MTDKPKCQHCNERTGTRPRGLCWKCSQDAQVRAQYPTGNKFGRKLSRQEDEATEGKEMPPCSPTSTLPGTPAKLMVLAARAAAGVALFNQKDNNDHEGSDKPVLANMGRVAYAELLTWYDHGKKRMALSPSTLKRLANGKKDREGYGGRSSKAGKEK